MFNSKKSIQFQNISSQDYFLGDRELIMMREDEVHQFVSGNKFRKLKYNLEDAGLQKKDTILTFGGAYSNHIAAVAAAGKLAGFKTIGVIRGEELATATKKNPTLSFAEDNDMILDYVTRESYREKDEAHFISKLKNKFGDAYFIPEGGTNALAVKGCEEILSSKTDRFDYICTPVGTGGTVSGLISASQPHQTVIGYSALKGNFQISEIEKYTSKTNYKIIDEYCFGGYGKIDATLVRFINEFKKCTSIPLDPVYTAKMMYGILQMIKDGKFKENSRILAVHTGGLQGIAGMNELLKKKQLPQIE